METTKIWLYLALSTVKRRDLFANPVIRLDPKVS